MSRVPPLQVVLTEAQVKEALSLYLDHIFDAAAGSYKAKTVDMYGLQASIYLDQPKEDVSAG